MVSSAAKCQRCNDSGVVASPDGEALDCPCSEGCICENFITDLDCPVHGWQEIAPGVKAVCGA